MPMIALLAGLAVCSASEAWAGSDMVLRHHVGLVPVGCGGATNFHSLHSPWCFLLTEINRECTLP